MSPADVLFWSVFGLIGLQRLGELGLVRAHERRLAARGAVRAEPDGFWGLFAVHAALLVLLPLEWFLAPWTRLGPHTVPLLALAGFAMLLHYWAAASLGAHYTVRVLRLPHARLVSRGPYRWLRHPIYAAVAVEVFAFPYAVSAWLTGTVLGASNLLALRRRVRIEEAHLGLAPS